MSLSAQPCAAPSGMAIAPQHDPRLQAVLDAVLPGDAGLGLPPASATGFELYAQRHGVWPLVGDFLACLAAEPTLLAMTPAERLAAVNACKGGNFRLYSGFITHVLRAYYTHPQVLQALSVGAAPPFPAGRPMPDDDWTLLEAVYERGPLYRPADTS